MVWTRKRQRLAAFALSLAMACGPVVAEAQRYRGDHGYHRPYGGRYRGRGNGGSFIGGALLGLGAGALISGALNRPYGPPRAYYAPPPVYYPPPPPAVYAPPPAAYYPY